VFKQKHFRKGIIAITAFLFLLSSVEWTYLKEDKIQSSNLRTEQLQTAAVSEKILLNKKTEVLSCLTTKNIFSEIHFEQASPLPGLSPYPSSVERYLLIRSLLI
jgi:hypothetical protein